MSYETHMGSGPGPAGPVEPAAAGPAVVAPRAARATDNAPPYLTGLIGLAVLLAAFLYWPRGAFGDRRDDLIGFLGLIAGAMILSDALLFRTYRQPDAGLATGWRRHWTAADLRAVADKLVGIAATLGLAVLCYTMLPLYQEPWYRANTLLLLDNLPVAALVLALYVGLLHALSAGREDGWSAVGRLLRSAGREGDRGEATDHLLGTLVKIFYLPLMFGYALDDWEFFYSTSFQLGSFRSWYEFLYRFLFFVDVCFGTIGYAVSLRLLNAHIRWPERTFRGWFVCLVCYMPFWQLVGRDYLNYGDDIVWGSVFAEGSAGYVIWGSAILLLTALFVASTVAFGLRFSNLTYRGTVRRGPYALMAHPAYVTKNLSYWMIQLPFLGASPAIAAQNTLALIGVNLLYYARARHEERCCGAHRDYRLYRRHLRRFGPLGRLRRRLRAGPQGA